MKTKTIVICAVFAAVMCVFSVMTIPIGVVPISLATFGVMLTSVILGIKRGPISIFVFILLGTVGLPVFSGFKGGPQVLAGPTGGYIWSYIIMALIIGAFMIHLPQSKPLSLIKIFAACIIAIIVNYAAGTMQFMFVQKMDLAKSLAACVVPFIPFDIIKAIVATYVGYVIRQALIKSNLLQEKQA